MAPALPATARRGAPLAGAGRGRASRRGPRRKQTRDNSAPLPCFSFRGTGKMRRPLLALRQPHTWLRCPALASIKRGWRWEAAALGLYVLFLGKASPRAHPALGTSRLLAPFGSCTWGGGSCLYCRGAPCARGEGPAQVLPSGGRSEAARARLLPVCRSVSLCGRAARAGPAVPRRPPGLRWALGTGQRARASLDVLPLSAKPGAGSAGISRVPGQSRARMSHAPRSPPRLVPVGTRWLQLLHVPPPPLPARMQPGAPEPLRPGCLPGRPLPGSSLLPSPQPRP